MKLRELIAKKNKMVEEAKALLAEGKIAEAEAKKVEVENLNKTIELMVEIEEEGAKNVVEDEPVANPKKAEPKNYEKNSFIGFLRNKIDPVAYPVTDAMKEFSPVAVMKTDDAAPGASVVVPVDVSEEIKLLRRDYPNLESLVNVESVSTLSGSRVIEANAALAPFPAVDEGTQFPDAPTPQFEKVTYKVNKYGDILKLTYELAQDAPRLLTYIKSWFAKRGTATRNNLILAAVDAVLTEPVAIDHVDDLKSIINVTLPVASALDIAIVTNQDGFNYLDTLKYADGKYVMQPDPTLATKELVLFGKYPVKVIPNATLQTKLGKAPVYIGDFKAAVTLFDREQGTVDFNDKGNGYWDFDIMGMKGRERLDAKVVDKTALVKGEVTIA